MVKKINKKAFTLIEVIVVVAIIGILTLLAVPRFIGQTQKAELVGIQHDVKAMEKEIGAKLINGDDEFNKWESNSKDLNKLAENKELFEKEGRVAKDGDPIDGTYKVIPKEYKDKINTKLKGTFYANSGGKVYYEHGEMPGYSAEKINDLIKQGYIPIATADELNNVRSATLETYGAGTKWEGKYTGGLDKKYVQVKDIDLSEYGDWTPIGDDYSSIFRGSFNGNGYKITGLTINRPETNNVGLFGYTEGAIISNVGLINNKVTGKSHVGGLVGYARNDTKISNSYATGAVTGNSHVGGLVGVSSVNSNISTIENSYTTGSVTGEVFVGGLVGNANFSTISNSYATGSVTGNYHVGGLVGDANFGNISNSYATGTVTGSVSESDVGGVGGLVGYAREIIIEKSQATGAVTGRNWVGGLVGDTYSSNISNSHATGTVEGSGDRVGGLVGNTYSSNISNSHATGTVEGSGDRVGGLVGVAHDGTMISNSYSTGSVTGEGNVGGLVGYAGLEGLSGSLSGTSIVISNSYTIGLVKGTERVGGLAGSADDNTVISNSYWDRETTGQYTSAGQDDSFGKLTVEMKIQTTYTGWDFDTVWEINEDNDYPKLR